jgi:hypothetical protein
MAHIYCLTALSYKARLTWTYCLCFVLCAIPSLKSDVILTLVLDTAFVKMTPVENHLPVLAAIPGQDMHVIYVTFAYQILDHSNRVDRYTGNYCCLKCIFPYSGMDENGTYLLFDSAFL